MKVQQACKTSRWMALKSRLNNLSPQSFNKGINQAIDNYVIIDVRTASEFSGGHIDGADNIDYFADELWEQLEKIDKEKNIYVYCRSGRRSLRVCTLLINGGFDRSKVFNLDGGWNEWLKFKSLNRA